MLQVPKQAHISHQLSLPHKKQVFLSIVNSFAIKITSKLILSYL